VVGLFWLNAQLRSQKHEVRHEANRMLVSVATAGLLPHLFKYLINRKRPDRTLVHGPRHGEFGRFLAKSKQKEKLAISGSISRNCARHFSLLIGRALPGTLGEASRTT
jgi:hypothetical protein